VTLPPVAELAARIRAGEVAALARSITVAESRLPTHLALTRELLERVLPRTGGSHRVGITGAPGVGKSTLIGQLAGPLGSAGERVAVLAVDPSSARTGGAILADRVRMGECAAAGVFIRPSPSAGASGGLGPGTRESILLCEAAGYTTVVVETVGVGQGEYAVAEAVDTVVVLISPGAGDELQGMKRGLLEVADVVAVTKADGPDRERAQRTAGDYRRAMRLFAPRTPAWLPRVLTCSAQTGAGISELWAAVAEHRSVMTTTGEQERRRADQREAWLGSSLAGALQAAFEGRPGTVERLAALRPRVRAGTLLPTSAALLAVGPAGGSPADR